MDRRPFAAGAVAVLVAAAALAAALLPHAVSAATCEEREVEIGIVKAKGCIETVTPSDADPYYEAKQNFTLNGYKVTPAQGAKVQLIPGSETQGRQRGAQVKTVGGAVSFATQDGTWHWVETQLNLTPPKSGDMLLFEGKLTQPGGTIVGLQPAIGVNQPVSINDEGGGSFGLSFDLASIMKMVDKNQTFGFEVEVGEDGKLGFEGFNVTLQGIGIGHFLELSTLGVEAKFKDGQLTGIGGDIDGTFAALKGVDLGGGFLYDSGRLERLSASISELNEPLGPSGIFLQKLAFDAFLAEPYGGKGTIGLTVGREFKVFGTEVSAVAADGSIEIRGADVTHSKPAFFNVGGAFRVVGIPVGDAHFRYDFGVGTDFGARVGIGLPSLTNDPNQPTYLGAGVDGWTTANHFLLTGDGGLKVVGLDILKGDVALSDIGFGLCAKILWWWGGAGVRWSDGQVSDIGGSTCDIGRYKPSRATVAALASGHEAKLNLRKGHEFVRVVGDDEPPQLTMTHESGRTLTTPPPGDEDGVQRAPGAIALSMTEGDTAFFLIRNPKGGWTLDPQEGSAEIESVDIASELPPHGLEAEIEGRRNKRMRTLEWNARDIRHQKLVFVEVLPNGTEVPILRTEQSEGRRKVRLASGVGTYGARKLRVHVLQRFETPRDELIADRYRVRRPPRPTQPTRVRAERRLRDVLVRWTPGSRAAEQEVVLRTGDGARYAAQVGRRAHRQIFRDVSVGERVKVNVFGVDRDGRRGKAGRARLDTSEVVKSRRAALRRLLGHARAGSNGALLSSAACPAVGAHCELRLVARKRGRVLGAKTLTIPEDMTDRMRVELKPGVSRRLRRGGEVRGVRLIASVDNDADERVKASKRTTLGA